MPGIADATTVTAVYVGGSETSYAIDADGDVWVWGAFQGQKFVHPTKVPFIDHVVMVAPGAGGDTVVLKDDGTVWAWGSMPESENGSYLGQNSTIPVRINISDVKSISSTGRTVYMVKIDGTIWTCGNGLTLGLDDIIHGKYTLEPVQLPIGNVSKVVPTQSFVYVEKEDGSWWSWGENRDYQLNDGTNVNKESPVPMQLDNVKSVSAKSICYGVNDEYVSTSGVLALDNNGQVYGWGDNRFRVSGDSKIPAFGNTMEGKGFIVSSPHPVPGLSNAREIGCGIGYYVALMKDGTVWAWGNNPESEDGRSSLDSNTPVRLAGFIDIESIIVGDRHLLAVKKDGTVWAWGSNRNGELGNGEISTRGGKSQAVQVTDLYVDLPSRTDTTMATSTPAQAPGYSFNTIAMLGCLLITTGLLAGLVRRNNR